MGGSQSDTPGPKPSNPATGYVAYLSNGRVPTYDFHTNETTIGINWYPNYWVRYMVDLGIDRLRDPSTIGAEPQTYYVVLQRVQFRF